MQASSPSSPSSPSDPDRANIVVVRAFMRDVWDAGAPAAAASFLSQDYVDHAYQPSDIEGLKAMLVTLVHAFPDQQTLIEDCIADGDKIALKGRITGTHRGQFRTKSATGNRIDVRIMRWFRLKDGKIAEHWALLDNYALFRQIDMVV